MMKKRLDDHRELLIEDSEGDREEVETSERSWSQQSLAAFNQWPHVFNLTNCIVGVSVLAMPYCLQQCGILLGTILIGGCSLLTKITCHLLYKSAIITRRRSYEAVALYAFGSGGRRLIEMLMLLFLMSSIVSFMVVIGDIGPHVLADYLQLQAPTQRLRILVMVFMFLFVILPLSLIKNLDSLSVISSITVSFYFIFVIRMLIECIPRIFDGRWSQDVYWWRQEGILASLPIISMALSCQTQLFCVADCIKDPASAKVDTVVSGAVNICSAIYAAVGLFGYVAFHDTSLHGDILLYLQPTFLTQCLKLAFMLSVAFSVPLMLFPSRNACYNLFLRPSIGEFTVTTMRPLTFLLLTVLLLLITLLLAIVVPNVEFILGLTGALICSLISIIIPSVLFIAICPSSKQNDSLLIYAKVSVVIGALMLVCSTWTVLHTNRESNVVDIILPKQLADIEKAEDSLVVPESQKIIDMVDAFNDSVKSPPNAPKEVKEIEKRKEEMGEEAKKILAEMKEQRKEQDKMIKEQQAIVNELNKHHQMHVNEEKVLEKEKQKDVKRDAGELRKALKEEDTVTNNNKELERNLAETLEKDPKVTAIEGDGVKQSVVDVHDTKTANLSDNVRTQDEQQGAVKNEEARGSRNAPNAVNASRRKRSLTVTDLRDTKDTSTSGLSLQQDNATNNKKELATNENLPNSFSSGGSLSQSERSTNDSVGAAANSHRLAGA